jgi:outer membrane lipoprotein SlyB
MTRTWKHPLHLFVVASSVLSLVLGGCGRTSSATPNDPEASESSGRQEDSLFSGLFSSAPVEVTLPTGTVVVVRFDQTLSSSENRPGDSFSATVQQDVAAEGKVAIPRGSTIFGAVTEAHGAEKIGGRARLSLSFDTLRLTSGLEVSITAVFAGRGKSETAKDAAIIGGSTLGGAILGNAVHEGEGSVVGAIVGGLAGTAAAKKTHGKPVVVSSGTVMSIRLSEPATVEVGG